MKPTVSLDLAGPFTAEQATRFDRLITFSCTGREEIARDAAEHLIWTMRYLAPRACHDWMIYQDAWRHEVARRAADWTEDCR